MERGNRGLDPNCPYGDRACPKVTEIEEDLKETRADISRMSRVLYIIAGILAMQLGVTII